MIHTTENFFNKVATELDSVYFKDVKYYRDDENCTKVHYTLELFNNGCLTYRQLINRLAKSCKDTTEKIHNIVSKYVISFGSYRYKPAKRYIAIAISKSNYWICLSKPCSKKSTLLFKDCLCRDEVFAIKTEKEVENYKLILK